MKLQSAAEMTAPAQAVTKTATYTAAQYNTYTRDNLTAIWVYTTAGDLAYATGATTLARLGIGSNGSYLESTGSVPQWTKLYRPVSMPLNAEIALNAGEDIARWRVPSFLNAWILSSVAACRKSGTGLLSIGIRNATTGNEMLSTNLTVDSGETDTLTAATPAVINASFKTVSTGDQIAFDVDGAGTSTLYAQAELVFAKS
jgi:hypothetical protein